MPKLQCGSTYIVSYIAHSHELHDIISHIPDDEASLFNNDYVPVWLKMNIW